MCAGFRTKLTRNLGNLILKLVWWMRVVFPLERIVLRLFAYVHVWRRLEQTVSIGKCISSSCSAFGNTCWRRPPTDLQENYSDRFSHRCEVGYMPWPLGKTLRFSSCGFFYWKFSRKMWNVNHCVTVKSCESEHGSQTTMSNLSVNCAVHSCEPAIYGILVD